jgi:protein-glutamine gamma-glutamyltransferase
MIKLAGKIVSLNDILKQWPWGGTIQKDIIKKMDASSVTFEYSNFDYMRYEVILRTNLILASKELHKSGLSFAVFKNAKCNEKYWTIKNGGWQLKSGWVKEPSKAILDIYDNGQNYATECATAMLIVYYRAVHDSIGKLEFDNLFNKGLLLLDWYSHSQIPTWYVPGFYGLMKQLAYLPGDQRYFKNPEVNSMTPEWQGENVIDLGDGTYYGHGIGIKSATQIINSLNAHRKPGATKSAYLMDSASRPNIQFLSTKIEIQDSVMKLIVKLNKHFDRFLFPRQKLPWI